MHGEARMRELRQIGLHGRLHVGILQLDGQLPPVVARALCTCPSDADAAARGVEDGECVCQSGPSSAAMRRRTKAEPIGGAWHLQLRQLPRIFGRQRVGNGRQQLRHLHDRPLEAAQRLRQGCGVAGSVALHAEKALAGHARRHRADIGADAHIARGPRREPVLFVVFWVGQGDGSPRLQYWVADAGVQGLASTKCMLEAANALSGVM